MEKKEKTTVKEESDFVDEAYVKELRFDITCPMRYFESLKVRDLIVGRIAMFLLLSLSIVTISIPSVANFWWGKLIIAVFTVFPTVALYWVGKNGYFLSVSSLFNMILHKNLTPLKMCHGITQSQAEYIEEQKTLLNMYVADCPDLTLLLVLHVNYARKTINHDYRRLADSPRFKEQLKVNFWIFILAHFFACQRIADEKTRIIRAILDEVDKKQIAKIK